MPEERRCRGRRWADERASQQETQTSAYTTAPHLDSTPVLGGVLCAGMALLSQPGAYVRAAVVLAAGVVLYFLLARPALRAARV